MKFSPSRMEHFAGGFPHRIDCDKWSLGLEEYGNQNDVLITHLAVPADSEYRDANLKELQEMLKGKEIANADWRVYSLVNYRDQQVRHLLEQLAETPDSELTNHGGSVSIYVPSIARNALRYWKFQEDIKDPRN